MNTHDRFRRALESLGLTTTTAANALGCHRSFVSLLQTGRVRPGLALAVAIERMTENVVGGSIRAGDWLQAPNAPKRRAAPARAAA